MADEVPGSVPSMGWILLTNDDGIDAPGLTAFANALRSTAPVEVVVPDRERSWIGKAITRFDPVTVEVVERDDLRLHVCSGYPADCVQLGIHTLFDEPPALVVSGINMGFNYGSAYLQGSGTVGAALEAGISGVTGVAVSTGAPDRDWHEWRDWVETPEAQPMWASVAEVSAALVAPLLDWTGEQLILSYNVPEDADADTPRHVTPVAEVGYDRLFSPAGPGTYIHDYRGDLRHLADTDGTDIAVASRGEISITPVRSAHTGRLPDGADALLGV